MLVWSKRSPDFKNEKYVVWAGPASSLKCPALVVLPTGNESLITLPWGEGVYFFPSREKIWVKEAGMIKKKGSN